MKKKHRTIVGLALGALVLGVLVGLVTVGTVAADPTPGVKIQAPRIDVGDALGVCTDTCDACEDLCDPDSPRYDYDDCAACEAACDDCVQDNYWETWIQVQNVSPPDPDTGVEPATGAIFLGWGEYSGLCPTNDPGVIAHYCQLIRGNAIWTLRTQIDEDVKSAIIYSVREDVFQEACLASELTQGDKEAWACWVEEWEHGTCEDTGGGWADPPGAQGEELAVTVTRYGPNDYGTFVSSTYTGISREMEGEDSPYEYYAPYIMKGYNGLDTELTIQNSGEVCTSVWIDYMEQGSCNILYKQHIEQLAPGEAVRLKVPCNTGQIPCFWLGSAHIAAEQPLGIIVDETSFEVPCMGTDRGTLLTHRARPKKELRDGEVITDTIVYADLLFREWSGWDASIQVQNLSRTGQHTFVTVDFMDNSGDEILFLADWVCPGGSATFYLPVVNNLGFEYVGAAEIQSHAQVDYPGEETPAQPIFAVVDLKKPDDPLTPQMDAQGGSYNAHPYSQKEWVSEVSLPFMAKDARDMYTPWTSLIAIRNNSNCNKIKPEIHFKDETGTVVCKLNSFWLRPKHVKLIDLNNIGCLYPGYIGAARVYVKDFEQLCDLDSDGHVDNEPLMPSVIVVEKGLYGSGIDAGDITNIYEGIPYATNIPPCYGDVLGKVHSIDPCSEPGFDAAEPIWLPGQDPQGVTVSEVVFEEAPFSVSGYAYVGEDCEVLTIERLVDTSVELQVETWNEDDASWEWLVDDTTTTSDEGFFQFEDALELEDGEDPVVWEDGDERAYRLKLSLETNGTVSYTSDEFNDVGNWTMNFRIESTNGGLDTTSGTWCDPQYIDPVVIERTWAAETNSTGDYEAEELEAGDLDLEFSMTDFLTHTTSIDLDCGEDEVLDAELLCLGEVGFKVVTSLATDENTSTIAGAKVTYSKPYGEKAAHYRRPDVPLGDYYVTSGETDNTGVLTLTVPILNATGTFTVSAPDIAETGVFTWTQMVNTPTARTDDSIFGGDVHNSRVLSPTVPAVGPGPIDVEDLEEVGAWFGFDDGSCANINSASRFLNNQDVELVLCGYGTVAGQVTVGEVEVSDQLVEVIMNGEVVGQDYTGPTGTYIVGEIPTGCFGESGCDDYTVRCMGWTQGPFTWQGCGDVDGVDFSF